MKKRKILFLLILSCVISSCKLTNKGEESTSSIQQKEGKYDFVENFNLVIKEEDAYLNDLDKEEDIYNLENNETYYLTLSYTIPDFVYDKGIEEYKTVLTVGINDRIELINMLEEATSANVENVVVTERSKQYGKCTIKNSSLEKASKDVNFTIKFTYDDRDKFPVVIFINDIRFFPKSGLLDATYYLWNSSASYGNYYYKVGEYTKSEGLLFSGVYKSEGIVSKNYSQVYVSASNRLSGVLREELEDIVIMDCINGVPIDTIGSKCFGYNFEFSNTFTKTITVGDSVVTIMDEAFAYCVALNTVNIGKNVKSIGKDVFKGCDKLKKIIYSGTKAMWNKIDGHENVNVEVICSNGSIKQS